MGWLGTLTGVGNVGTDLGNADVQERQFQMQRQQAASEAAYKQALAQFNLGNLALENRKFDAGRWSIDNSNPYISNPDGSVSLVEHDRNGGAPRLTPMPKGFQIPNSIGDLTATLRRNFPDATPEQIRDMVSYKLGLKSPWAALTPTVGIDPVTKQPVAGITDKRTNTWTPSTAAGGGQVQKPVPIAYVPSVDTAGNPTTVAAPRYSNVGGGRAATAPTASGSGTPLVGGHGIIKSWAQLSPDAQKQVQRISSTVHMLQDLQSTLEEKDANGVPLYAQGSQGMQKLQSVWQNILYNHGISGDETWQKLIQEGTLADFTGVMGLIPGLRRGDLIKDAMSHLPERADSMAMMHQKVLEGEKLLNGSLRTTIRAEQQNRQGKLMNQSPEAAADSVTAPFGGTLTPPASSILPPQAAAQLKEGAKTTFANGQVWTKVNGVPAQVK